MNTFPLSKNNRDFIQGCATVTSTTSNEKEKTLPIYKCSANGSILRMDGRAADEYRPLRFTFNRDECFSQCIVQFYGGSSNSYKGYGITNSISASSSTQVECTISCMLVPPSMDRPNEGNVSFNLEHIPISKMLSENNCFCEKNRIIRLLERILLVSPGGAIDVESLCISSFKWVWSLSVQLTVLQQGGNIIDASIMSVMGALEYLRLPEVDVSTSKPIYISSYVREPIPLGIHHRPLAITYAIYAHPNILSRYTTLMDPSMSEEYVQDGRMTIALNKYSEICAVDFPGGCELQHSHLSECLQLGAETCVNLDKALDLALEKAKVKSLLHFRKRAESKIAPTKSCFDEYNRIVMSIDLDHDIQKTTENDTKEDEEYKLQALDYKSGHIAGKVRESVHNFKASIEESEVSNSSRLMLNMLKIAKNKMRH